ncbi:hypothetical protein [Metapseudomonas otitidis]|uniref:hypothetical protein n=1 Tax=Metapseudomonas otitidis TaxID=319939 RepID=UPI000D1AA9C4|nr:hypothetical protein [Pseudomonas otitidis]
MIDDLDGREPPTLGGVELPRATADNLRLLLARLDAAPDAAGVAVEAARLDGFLLALEAARTVYDLEASQLRGFFARAEAEALEQLEGLPA